MGPHTWATDPMAAARHWGSRPGGQQLVWAWFAADSLHYLDDLDRDVQANYPAAVMHGYSGDIVDIAHVRWASGTAITALDLCAAALAVRYCGWTPKQEADLRDFDTRLPPQPTKGQQQGAASAASRLAALAAPFAAWVDDVLNDPDYELLHPARNRFTHAWLSRTLRVGINAPSGGHAGRTGFDIDGSTTHRARELVETATRLVTRRLERFLAIVMQQP